MNSTILHIGAHKSGSSTIQAFLASNWARLAENNIDFPIFDAVTASPKMHSKIVDIVRNDLFNLKFAKFLHERKTKSDTATTIFSSENFYPYSSPEIIARLKHWLPRNTRVLCYLRDPVDHVVSLYAQHVRGKRQTRESIDEFFERQTRGLTRDRGTSYYRYDANMSGWRHGFADTNAYHYTRATSRELVARFISDCGLSDIDLDEFTIPPDNNVTGSLETLRVLLELNRMVARGTIAPEQHLLWFRRALARDADCRDAVRTKVLWHTVDTGAFVDAFRACNPDFLASHPTATLPRSVSFPDRLDMSEHELFDLMTMLAAPARDAR